MSEDDQSDKSLLVIFAFDQFLQFIQFELLVLKGDLPRAWVINP